MNFKIAIMLIALISVLGAIAVQGKSNLDVSLNEPAPFPKRM